MANSRSSVIKRKVKSVINNEVSKDKKVIEEELLEYIDLYQQSTEVSKRMGEIQLNVFELMKKHSLAHISIEGVEAVVDRPVGRTSTFVDPKDLYTLLKGKDSFFDCVKVQITEAKKVVTEKILNTIAKKESGKVGDPRLTIAINGKE